MSAELDNPVWSCLSTRHAHFAQGGEFARRYEPDMSPIAAIASPAPAHVAALEALYNAGEVLAIAASFVPTLSRDWELLQEAHIVQMIRDGTAPAKEGDVDVVTLSAADADAMLALVDLTHPGPFRRRTVELGTFIGIREEGRLIAMAGQRLWVGDHRELSGVCTHPDAQGRGYARALMGRIINRTLSAGQVPFLHVESTNARAIDIYRALGFVERAKLPLRVAIRSTSTHR